MADNTRAGADVPNVVGDARAGPVRRTRPSVSFGSSLFSGLGGSGMDGPNLIPSAGNSWGSPRQPGAWGGGNNHLAKIVGGSNSPSGELDLDLNDVVNTTTAQLGGMVVTEKEAADAAAKDAPASTKAGKKKKGSKKPATRIFMSGGRGGPGYGRVANDNGRGGTGSGAASGMRGSEGIGNGHGGGRQEPMMGHVTRVFPQFCIVNNDVYVSKGVVERDEAWPPRVGFGVRMTIVPHQQGRNRWKALSYDREPNNDIHDPSLLMAHLYAPHNPGYMGYMMPRPPSQQHMFMQQMNVQQAGMYPPAVPMMNPDMMGQNFGVQQPAAPHVPDPTAAPIEGGDATDADAVVAGVAPSHLLQPQQHMNMMHTHMMGAMQPAMAPMGYGMSQVPYGQPAMHHSMGQPPSMPSGMSSTGLPVIVGPITRVFEAFCILNHDVYVSKAVTERAGFTWPVTTQTTARVAVLPHHQRRNNWKAVSFEPLGSSVMMGGGLPPQAAPSLNPDAQ
jgi:hypothetical protein